MPPFGLYRIPHHHLVDNARIRRQTFNAQDFDDDVTTAKPADLPEPPADTQLDGTAEAKVRKKDQHRKEKRKSSGIASGNVKEMESGTHVESPKLSHRSHGEKKDKKGKHRDSGTHREGGKDDQAATLKGKEKKKHRDSETHRDGEKIDQDGTSESNGKRKSDKHRRKSEAAAEAPETPVKKRKRESELPTITSTPLSSSKASAGNDYGGSFLGHDFMADLKRKMEVSSLVAREPEHKESKSETADKKSKKAKIASEEQQTSKLDSISMEKATGPRIEADTPGSRKSDTMSNKRKHKKHKRQKKDITEQKPDLSNKMRAETAVSSKDSDFISPMSSTSSSGLERDADPKKIRKAVTSEVMILETPPSVAATTPRIISTTPVPFPVLQRANPSQPPTSNSRSKNNTDAPLAKTEDNSQTSDAEEPQPTASATETTQPLSSTLKMTPKRKVSPASSFSSSASSMSIKDVYLRPTPSNVKDKAKALPKTMQPKLTSSSPFITQPNQPAAPTSFTHHYTALQNLVSFADESEYHAQHLDTRETNRSRYPLPCLGALTGCHHKKDHAALINTRGGAAGDPAMLATAANSGAQAEKLLELALRAHVPIPLGEIEGTWSLYCEGYSIRHFDRYGYGTRRLSISALPNSHASSSSSAPLYTAHLTIPPRPTPYSILPFTAPPHASFRSTVLQTAVEGYRMEAVFLGNGYCLLRLDLNLLLKGRPADHGARVVLEFLGVREGAVAWNEEVKGREGEGEDDGE